MNKAALPILGLMAALAAGQSLAGPSSTGNDLAAAPKAKSLSTPKHKPKLDHSGQAHRGKASFYGGPFAGKKMADGTPMNPKADIAASKTLPLGTVARVTNLENGKSSTVEIKDRGPYVDGRIIDVSPRVAEKLDMKRQGVALVVVAPIAVPQEDGSIRSGSGAGSRAGNGAQSAGSSADGATVSALQ
jgi:rare lipoprotein A